MTLTIDPSHFRARLLQDMLTEATAHYWLRRAQQFQAVGTEACDHTAMLCRFHAALIQDASPEPISEEVIQALGEVT